jgi:acyl carrier protein
MNDKIKQIMAQVFKVPVEMVNEQSSQDSIENWDSLHHMKMIVLLEREFDIAIPDERVGNMISYKLIKTIINECVRPQLSEDHSR